MVGPAVEEGRDPIVLCDGLVGLRDRPLLLDGFVGFLARGLCDDLSDMTLLTGTADVSVQPTLSTTPGRCGVPRPRFGGCSAVRPWVWRRPDYQRPGKPPSSSPRCMAVSSALPTCPSAGAECAGPERSASTPSGLSRGVAAIRPDQTRGGGRLDLNRICTGGRRSAPVPAGDRRVLAVGADVMSKAPSPGRCARPGLSSRTTRARPPTCEMLPTTRSYAPRWAVGRLTERPIRAALSPSSSTHRAGRGADMASSIAWAWRRWRLSAAEMPE